jgi:hypothetical protein
VQDPVEAREKNLFSDILSIMSKEEVTLANFIAVFTTLISEYLTNPSDPCFLLAA